MGEASVTAMATQSERYLQGYEVLAAVQQKKPTTEVVGSLF
jgi:hypothetical protein